MELGEALLAVGAGERAASFEPDFERYLNWGPNARYALLAGTANPIRCAWATILNAVVPLPSLPTGRRSGRAPPLRARRGAPPCASR